MIKKLFIIFVSLFLFCSLSFADAIYLKNGQKIEGEVLGIVGNQAKINVKGVTLTYYNDEIERIESEKVATPMSLTTPKEQPSVPKPSGLPRQVQGSSLPSTAATSLAPKPQLSSSMGQPMATKRELILRMIAASGARDNMNQMLSEMMAQATPEQASKLKEIMNIDEIISTMVPIYEKYFTESELAELIIFYQSPAGQKLLKVTPSIMQEVAQTSMMYLQTKIQGLEGQ